MKELERLKEDNKAYLDAKTNLGDISLPKREETCRKGQFPYATIIACSDSREVPEHIFGAGIGELFVIRTAGNTLGEHELGSVEYAVGHLHTKLVVVLGHTHCGAVHAALEGKQHGHVASITDMILDAAGDEKDETNVSILNVKRGVSIIKGSVDIPEGYEVIGALYHIDTGIVEFL